MAEKKVVKAITIDDNADVEVKQEMTITVDGDMVHVNGWVTFDTLITVVSMLQEEVRRVLGLAEHEADKKEYVQ